METRDEEQQMNSARNESTREGQGNNQGTDGYQPRQPRQRMRIPVQRPAYGERASYPQRNGYGRNNDEGGFRPEGFGAALNNEDRGYQPRGGYNNRGGYGQ